MDDYSALLAAVHDRPEDDTPRLVLADFLDDHAGAVPCRVCKGEGEYSYRTRTAEMDRDDEGGVSSGRCGVCHGSGSVSNGNAERAEFIRVQVELARVWDNDDIAHAKGPIPSQMCGCRFCRLRTRELELWRTLNTSFDLIYPGGRIESRLPGDSGIGRESPIVVVARGFPAVAHLTMAAMMGGECGRCGGDTERQLYGSIRINRGCPACSGTGRTEGIAAQLGAVVGLTSVMATDREPMRESGGQGWHWTWETNLPGVAHAGLPREVMQDPLISASGIARLFRTREEAVDALGRRLLAHCRSLAKSPAVG